MSRMGSVNTELEKAAAEDREVDFSEKDMRWLLAWERTDILETAGYDVEEVRKALESPEDNGEATEGESPKDYRDMNVKELRAELAARQLPGDGNRDVLVARLEEDDTRQGS